MRHSKSVESHKPLSEKKQPETKRSTSQNVTKPPVIVSKQKTVSKKPTMTTMKSKASRNSNSLANVKKKNTMTK